MGFFIFTASVTLLIWVFSFIIYRYSKDFFDLDGDGIEAILFVVFISFVPIINLLLLLFVAAMAYTTGKEAHEKSYKKINRFYTCDYCEDLPYRYGQIYEHSYALMKTTTVCPGCEHDIEISKRKRANLDIETDVSYSQKFSNRAAFKLFNTLEKNENRFKQNELNARFQEVQTRIRPERLKRMEEELEKLKQQHFDAVNEESK